MALSAEGATDGMWVRPSAAELTKHLPYIPESLFKSVSGVQHHRNYCIGQIRVSVPIINAIASAMLVWEHDADDGALTCTDWKNSRIMLGVCCRRFRYTRIELISGSVCAHADSHSSTHLLLGRRFY